MILFGIDETSGYVITGVYDAQDLQNKVSEQALQMEPQLRPVFTVAEPEEKIVIAAEISECEILEKPCFYKGKGRLKGSCVRVGERDEPMTEYEVYSCEAFKRKLQDELTSVDRADLDDLDSALIQEYFIHLRQENPNLSHKSNERVLSLPGFVDKHSGHPTITGLMLFGRYPQAFYPQLCVTAMVVEGTENRYSGIPTMHRELAAAGLPGPVFENARGAFKITFQKEDWNSIEFTLKKLLYYCANPRSREEIAEFLEMSSVYHVIKKYIKPLFESGQMAMTMPNKPQSMHQRYVSTEFRNES